MPLQTGSNGTNIELIAESAVQVGAELVPGTEIVSVMLDERVGNAGYLHDVMTIGYQIYGLPGTFYVYPDASHRWGQAAPAYIAKRKAEIESIYQLGE